MLPAFGKERTTPAVNGVVPTTDSSGTGTPQIRNSKASGQHNNRANEYLTCCQAFPVGNATCPKGGIETTVCGGIFAFWALKAQRESQKFKLWITEPKMSPCGQGRSREIMGFAANRHRSDKIFLIQRNRNPYRFASQDKMPK
jgi:hypothetical protein